MTFMVVPHAVDKSTARVWVGAVDENIESKPLRLEFRKGAGEGEAEELDPSGWSRWRSWSPEDREAYRSWYRSLESFEPTVRTLDYRYVDLRALEPRTTYEVKLIVDGALNGREEHLRRARVTTLPEELPPHGEKPFTLFLGSCFYEPFDPSGRVGALYDRLSEEEKPDVKVLCGDQVYLDNPWPRTTLFWYYGFAAPGRFREELFEKYLATWKHSPEEGAGFRRLLEEGANYFCSDDHEFWNNAPNFGGVGMVNTLTRKDRDWWFEQATNLFRAFQAPSTIARFDVNPLSVCVADTRVGRDPSGWGFMKDDDFRKVTSWLQGLEGPGVLVLGQPLLARKSGFIKGLPFGLRSISFDRNLSDYHEQYDALVEEIKSSRHSVVILTGDVHYGRIAHGDLKPGSGKKFVEVISSPLQAVSGVTLKKPLFGRYEDAPTDRFPGLKSLKVTDQQNHFATVGFSSGVGGEVVMEVKYWPVPADEERLEVGHEVAFRTSLT